MDLWKHHYAQNFDEQHKIHVPEPTSKKMSWQTSPHLEDRILVPPVQTGQKVPKRQMKDARKGSVRAGEDPRATEVWETVNARETVNQDTETTLLVLT